jgi:hypothetical protein
MHVLIWIAATVGFGLLLALGMLSVLLDLLTRSTHEAPAVFKNEA